MFNTPIFKTVILFLVSFGLVACGNSEEETVREKEDVSRDLIVGVDKDISSIDPHGSNDSASRQVRRNIFETLLYQDVNLNIKPMLASEFKQIDPNTWNFKLRENTTFHSGQKFTAHDVKASLLRALDPTVAASSSFMYEMIEDIEIIDDYELNIHTQYPFAPLASNLAYNTSSIMSKTSIDKDYENAISKAGLDITLNEYYKLREENGELFTNISSQMGEYIGEVIQKEPDGTNHLKFSSRENGDNIVLEKFDRFNDGVRDFEKVTFRIIPEQSSRVVALETEGVDLINALNASGVNQLNESETTEIVTKDSVRSTYLGFNLKKAPFTDRKIRQAISYAIDKQEIVEGILENLGTKATTPLAKDVFGYDSQLEGIDFNLEKAKNLMKESTKSDGFKTTLWINEDPEINDTALFIVEALKEINIEVEIRNYEYAALFDELKKNEHDMFILGWSTVTADADYFFNVLFESSSIKEANNRTNFDNEAFDKLVQDARQEVDNDRRQTIYKEAQSILLKESPAAFIYNNKFAIGYNSEKLEGVEVDASGDIRLENIKFK